MPRAVLEQEVADLVVVFGGGGPGGGRHNGGDVNGILLEGAAKIRMTLSINRNRCLEGVAKPRVTLSIASLGFLSPVLYATMILNL